MRLFKKRSAPAFGAGSRRRAPSRASGPLSPAAQVLVDLAREHVRVGGGA